MRLAIALAASLIAFPAAASGGLWCGADDGKVEIDIDSGMTRGMGSPLFNFKATVTIEDEALPEDLRSVTFGRATQYWLDGESLNLLLYWEREGDKPHGYVQATIMTKYDDEEGSLDGEFEVIADDVEVFGSISEPRRYTGKISCGVE